MPIKFTYTMSFEDIREGSKSTGRRAKKVREDIHKLLVSTLHQWSKTGDVTVPVAVAAEVLAEQDAHYSQGIVNWFSVHAGFEYDAKEETFSYTKTTITEEEVLAAKAETFEELTPPKKAQPFNLDEKIKNLIKTAESRRTNGLGEKDVVPAEHIAALKAIVGLK